MATADDLTDAQVHGRDAARTVAALVRELETLAARLRRDSDQLLRGDGRATRVAADIASTYVQDTGAAGVWLRQLVVAAGDADRAHAAGETHEVTR